MTPILGFKNIAVLAEDNEDLAALGREHDALMEEFNALNEEIYSEEPPKRPAQEDTDRYNELGKRADDLQKRLLAWESKSRDFIMRPSMTYAHTGQFNEEDRRELQQQMVSSLTLARTGVAEARTTLANNHNHLVNRAEQNSNNHLARRSYDIGKWGLIVGAVGMILAILSLILG